MIGRVLKREREPGSIFEHIDSHIRPGVDGLAEGGEKLPDDAIAAEGAIAFAPGALEGVFAGPGDPAEVEAAVDRLYAALEALAAKPSAGTRRKLRERFREGGVRAKIDALRERLAESPPEHSVRLYPELRELFLRSGRRDEVKFAMALVSGFRRSEDADLFRIIGRHDEFTLYAAVALATVTDDALGEWLALLPHVSGWGRTELSGLILREPRSQLVREQVARHGLGVGNALELAVGCRLDELLARADVDDHAVAGARDILQSLAADWDSPATLTDYADAGVAVEALLARLAERDGGLDDFVAVDDLRSFLAADENRDGDGEGDRFEASGFTAERRARVLAQSAAYLGDARWPPLAETFMHGDDGATQWLGTEVASRLGVDLHDHLIALIEADPGDS
ncbi:MAG TPA: hypothetical protein VGK92_11330, partial [Gaiellales bacterium]